MTTYLSKQDVTYINGQVLRLRGVQSQLLNESALESALMRPQMAAYYQQVDIVVQAALLIAGIALSHAFLDGNKRTSLVAGYDFLKINGYQLTSPSLEFARQIEAIVNRAQPLDAAMQTFVAWLHTHIK